MRTFLRGTEHEPFLVWLTGPGRAQAGGDNLAKYDVDRDGAIAYEELVVACSNFLHGEKAEL